MNVPVAITGVGTVSPAGVGVRDFQDALFADGDIRGGWSRGDLTRYPHRDVIEIPAEALRRTGAPGGNAAGALDRLAGYTVDQALIDAGIERADARIGCFLSSTTAGVDAFEAWLLRDGDVDPAFLPDGARILSSAGRLWRGPAGVLSTACSSGVLAVTLAIDAIAAGEADAMVAGGLDVLLEYTVCGFNALRLTSDERCRPFGRGRKGVVLSEGAVAFCLEPLSAALRRNAEVWGVILGCGMSCDADHVTAPNAGGIARAMRMALETSGIGAGEIGGVFAHGTGTQANDSTEMDALRLVFGERAVPPVTAIKSVLGHPQAAAGAFSLLAAVLALRSGRLPPTAGLGEVDPALGEADIVTAAGGREISSSCLMINAFGFGGNNGVLIVSDLDTARREAGHAA
jgi:3-oxoacyl-(acyl-carrier-protein) synthase